MKPLPTTHLATCQPEFSRMAFTPETVRRILVALANERYPHLKLKESDVPLKIIEKHNRRHVAYTDQAMQAQAVEGHGGKCMYALALNALPGVVSSFLMRRVSYTLEYKGEKLAMFKFGTPDQARLREVQFDQRKPVKPHAINFLPLPASRQTAACAARVKKSQKKHGYKKYKRNPPTWSTLRMYFPSDLCAA